MNIGIIGSGKAAHFFATTCKAAGHSILEVHSKQVIHANAFAQRYQANVVSSAATFSHDLHAILCAVPDDALATLELHTNAVVVHHSGATGFEATQPYSQHLACVWPVVSINKDSAFHSQQIPVVVTSNSHTAHEAALAIASSVSQHIHPMTNAKKQAAHLVATMSNNFANYVYTIAADVCKQFQLDSQLFIPMLVQCAQQLHYHEPAAVQTGPALRGDDGTMQVHQALIKSNSTALALYTFMSEQIKAYHAKLSV